MNCKDMEGNRRGLLEVLSSYLSRSAEVHHDEPQSELLVSRWRLEPVTSRVRLYSAAAAALFCLVVTKPLKANVVFIVTVIWSAS